MLLSASVLVSVNVQLMSTQSKVNPAIGGTPGSISVISCDAVLLMPVASVTVSETVYVPAAPYVCAGFVSGEVSPSPKLQLQLAMSLVGSVLVSVNSQSQKILQL